MEAPICARLPIGPVAPPENFFAAPMFSAALALEMLMARYFFDVSNGKDVSDDMGLDFDDAHTASQEALRSLPDMVKDQELGSVGGKVSITMRDGHGFLIYRATLTIEDEWLAGRP